MNTLRSTRRSLLGLTTLVLLALACDRAPEVTAPVAEAPPQDPAWTASATAPLYTVSLADGPRLVGPDGRPMASLGVTWEGAWGEAEGNGGCLADGLCLAEARGALSSWSMTETPTGHALTGRFEGEHATVTARWSLDRDTPIVQLKLSVTWTSDAHPDTESIQLRLAGAASVLGPDLRFVRPDGKGTAAVGPWVPHRSVSGAGENSIHLSAKGFLDLTARAVGEDTVLTLTLDDARMHPFEARGSCTEPASMAWDRWSRHAGESVEAEVSLWVGHSWAPVVHRLPRGFDAAVALIDTSPSKADELSALLWGYSQRDDPRYGNGGVHGHQLTLTKALYAGPTGYGNAEMARLARRSADLGGAFANLGPTDGDDDASLVEAGLTNMRGVGSRVWLDGDAAACDGLLDGGWRLPLGQVITGAGYDVVYASMTPAIEADDLNVLAAHAPFLWRHDRLGARRWMFQAVDLTAPRAWTRLNSNALSALGRSRGVSIVRAAIGNTQRGGGLRREESGAVVPTGDLERWLFELADAQERGEVWTTSVPDLIDQLQGARDLEVTPLADGRYRLRHDGPTSSLPVTLLLPGTSYRAEVGGIALPYRLDEGEGAQRSVLTWLTVEAGKPVEVAFVDQAGRRVQPLVPVRWQVEGRTTTAALP